MGWEIYDDDVREDYERNPRYCDRCGTRLEYNPYGPDCPNPGCPGKVGFPSDACQRCGGSLEEIDRAYGYPGGGYHDGRGPRMCRVMYRCRACGTQCTDEFED